MKLFQAQEQELKPLKRPFIGAKTPYLNIFLLGRKHSGKSNVAANLIDLLTSKHTYLTYYQPTHQQDSTKQAAQGVFEGRGYQRIANHFSLFDEKKQNLLQEQLKEMPRLLEAKYEHLLAADAPQKPDALRQKVQALLGEAEPEQKKKPIFPQKRYEYARFANVYDDLDINSLQDQALFQAMRTNRHFKLANIIAHHDFANGVPKKARANIDVLCLFGRLSEERLERIFEEMQPTKTLEYFKKAYYHATAEPFGFLTVDRTGGETRMYKGFDQPYAVEK